jgi:hypothetical protein
VAVKKTEAAGAGQSAPRSENRQGGFRPGAGRDDDGTMYNPFAEALKKMKEKK